MGEGLKHSTPEGMDEAAVHLNNARSLAEAADIIYEGPGAGDFKGPRTAMSAATEYSNNGREEIEVTIDDSIGRSGSYHYGIAQKNHFYDNPNDPLAAVEYRTSTYTHKKINGVVNDLRYDVPVSVNRVAKARDGSYVKGTVTQLTGENADRAREILTRRAARKIGKTSLNILKFE